VATINAKHTTAIASGAIHEKNLTSHEYAVELYIIRGNFGLPKWGTAVLKGYVESRTGQSLKSTGLIAAVCGVLGVRDCPSATHLTTHPPGSTCKLYRDGHLRPLEHPTPAYVATACRCKGYQQSRNSLSEIPRSRDTWLGGACPSFWRLSEVEQILRW
jgi:hypothetical protein